MIAAPGHLPKLSALTDWERQFVDVYVSNGKKNATRAYMAAKPRVTYKTARVEAHKTLTRPNIQAAINELAEYTRTADYLLPRVVARLREIAFQDRYVSYPEGDPGAPCLPGLEDALKPVMVEVRHGDSINACKILLQIGGVDLVETLRVGGNIAVAGDVGFTPQMAELVKKVMADVRVANA